MSSVEHDAADLRMDMAALLGAVLSKALRILLVTGVLLGAAAALLMFVPKLYESSASLLVEDRSSVYTRAAGELAPSTSAVNTEALMSSQIELIKSRDLLLEVVASEKLREVPEFSGAGFSPTGFLLNLVGRKPEPRSIDETVLVNLSSRMTVIRERDSAVISIYVRSANAELAARIANAVAAAHVKRRAAQSLADTTEASVWLEREIARLSGDVEIAETAVASFRIDNDLFLGPNSTPVADQQMSTVATQIVEAQQRKNAAQSRADLINGLIDGGKPLEGLVDVRESVVIQRLLETKGDLQSELAQKSTTLLNNHPTIKALKAQIAEIGDQVAAEGRKVAASLEAEAQVEGGLEQKLREDMTRAKVLASKATQGGVTLDGLERQAKAQRDLLETYMARYSDAVSRVGSNAALPDVRVVTEAAPSTEPASPKVPLILGAVGFVALALQIGIVLFGELMSGRALTPRWQHPAHDEETHVEPEAAAAGDLDALQPPPFERDDVVRFEDDDAPRPEDDEAASPVAGAHAELEHGPSIASGESAFAHLGDEPELAFEETMRPSEELDALAATVGAGRLRTVLLAGLGGADRDAVIDRLIDETLAAGLSIAIVDAGSGDVSLDEGLTDLSADRAEYGDVVQRVGDNVAEVPWGRLAAIDRRSGRPMTLVEALADIYHLVIVDTGSIGMTSSLPVFANCRAPVILVTDGAAGVAVVAAARRDVAMLGFDIGFVVAAPVLRADVA